MTKELENKKSISTASENNLRDKKTLPIDMEQDIHFQMPPKRKFTVEANVLNIKKAKPNINISDYDVILDLNDDEI